MYDQSGGGGESNESRIIYNLDQMAKNFKLLLKKPNRPLMVNLNNIQFHL